MSTKTSSEIAKDAARDLSQAVKATVAEKAARAKETAAETAEAEARSWDFVAAADVIETGRSRIEAALGDPATAADRSKGKAREKQTD